MGYRRVHRVDKNEPALVKLAVRLGCSWINMTSLGDNAPDGLLGFRGRNILVEFKNPEGLNQIAPGQKMFAESWRGDQVAYVRTEEDLCALLGVTITHYPKKAQKICGECGETPTFCRCREKEMNARIGLK